MKKTLSIALVLVVSLLSAGCFIEYRQDGSVWACEYFDEKYQISQKPTPYWGCSLLYKP